MRKKKEESADVSISDVPVPPVRAAAADSPENRLHWQDRPVNLDDTIIFNRRQ